MRSKFEKRRGIVAVLVAVSLVAILGVVAIALDAGLLLDNRRSVQASADAAALAAAEDLYANWYTNQGKDPSGTALASALSTAKADGYSNDGVTSVVTVNIPPLSGLAVNQPGYAEVIITYYQQRGFSSIFGSGNLPVKARAVARGMRKASGIGILLLDPTDNGSLTPASWLRGPGKWMEVSSSIPAVPRRWPSAAAVRAWNRLRNGHHGELQFLWLLSYFQASPGSVKTGQPATADFLAGVAVPDPTKINDQGNAGTMTTRSSSTLSPASNQTLQPGLYIGGINISSKTGIVFSPGVYYLQGGGLTMSGGSSSLTANGVMIYNGVGSGGTTGSITVSGGGTVVQSPPTSGIYYGMSIFQDRSSTQTITLSGASGWNFTGTVYAAAAPVDVSGGSGATMGSQFVADTMTLSGSSTFNDIDPSKGYAPRDIRLTE